MTTPLAWSSAPLAEIGKISGVCLDIDETLSTRGKLTAEAFNALWRLKKAGLAVVPITGRPAGWCDQIARFWPVDAVVGENGAFTFFLENGVRKRIDTPGGKGSNGNPKIDLERLGAKILGKFPQARWASDQGYREFDLAVDICEDVAPWPASDIEALLAMCKGEGAHAKLSSIHVNIWFGDYDKRRGLEHWLTEGAPGLASSQVPQNPSAWQSWLYIGDSPNDEPMFASFRNSVGVANLRQYLDRLSSPPRWITSCESGAGFAEMVDRLLEARAGLAG